MNPWHILEPDSVVDFFESFDHIGAHVEFEGLLHEIQRLAVLLDDVLESDLQTRGSQGKSG